MSGNIWGELGVGGKWEVKIILCHCIMYEILQEYI